MGDPPSPVGVIESQHMFNVAKLSDRQLWASECQHVTCISYIHDMHMQTIYTYQVFTLKRTLSFKPRSHIYVCNIYIGGHTLQLFNCEM